METARRQNWGKDQAQVEAQDQAQVDFQLLSACAQELLICWIQALDIGSGRKYKVS